MDEPAVATVVAPLVQTPPVIASLSVVQVPLQMPVIPVIAVGVMFTDMVLVAIQPVLSI